MAGAPRGWPLFVAPMVAFGIAWILTWSFSRPGSFLYVIDQPNARSLHTTPVSRSGGVALISGAVVGTFVGAAVGLPWLGATVAGATMASAVALLAAVSQLDDRYGVYPGYRLLVHLFAAGLLLWAGFGVERLEFPGGQIEVGPVAGGVGSVLLLVWFINLYNFMDGMDGFAGGMGVVGFSTLALLGSTAEAWGFSVFAAVIAAACGGFLLFNFPPARIFMGDTGASVLGCLAATMCLWAQGENLFPLWVGLLVFSPFVVDATFTLAKHAMAGRKIWRAHHSHCYQRLVRAGWGHRRTVLVAYVLMLACAASAVYALDAQPAEQLLLLAAWGVIYTSAIALVYRLDVPCE